MDAISKEELNDYHYRIVRDDGKVNRYDLLVGLEYYFSRRFGKPDIWKPEGKIKIEYGKQSDVIPRTIYAEAGDYQFKIRIEKNRTFTLEEITNGEHITYNTYEKYEKL